MQDQSFYELEATKRLRNVEQANDISSNLLKSMQKIAVKEGYTSCTVLKKRILLEGGNFVGELYEVNIVGKTKDGLKETNTFVKQGILKSSLKSVVDVNSVYSNEVFMYNELSKVFNGLQEKAGVSNKDRYRIAESFIETNIDAIILDNLAKKGFRTLNRMNVMSINFAEESIKQLAIFHGLSFVLKYKHKDYYEKNIRPIQTPLVFDKPWRELVEKITYSIFQCFEGKLLDQLKEFCYRLIDKIPKYIKGEMSFVKCLCHGDYRISNLLVKETDSGINVVPVDYQLMVNSSPVLDFMYFIYTGTDRKFRKRYFVHLKDLYYEKLTNFLKYFSMDINTVYTRKEYEKDFDTYMEYGFMVSLYPLPIILATDTEFPDISEENTNSTFKLDEVYKSRIKETVEEFFDLVYCDIVVEKQ